MPVSLISGAVAQVYLSELAEKERKGERIDFFLIKTMKLLAMTGIIPLLILIIIAPLLFELVFGNTWRGAGELAQLMAFAYYAKFIVSPLSMVYFVKNSVKLLSFIQFGRAISTIFILVISSIYFSTFKLVVVLYTIHEVIFYLTYLFSIYRLAIKKQ